MMFENCRSLAELNRERAQVVASGVDMKVVNSFYNARRREIMNQDIVFNKIDIHRPKSVEGSLYMLIPYKGKASIENTIELKEDGFYA